MEKQGRGYWNGKIYFYPCSTTQIPIPPLTCGGPIFVGPTCQWYTGNSGGGTRGTVYESYWNCSSLKMHEPLSDAQEDINAAQHAMDFELGRSEFWHFYKTYLEEESSSGSHKKFKRKEEKA